MVKGVEKMIENLFTGQFTRGFQKRIMEQRKTIYIEFLGTNFSAICQKFTKMAPSVSIYGATCWQF